MSGKNRIDQDKKGRKENYTIYCEIKWKNCQHVDFAW